MWHVARIVRGMADAWATYTLLSSDEVLVEVTYPDGRFGMERVRRPRRGDLREAAYAAASVKTTIQGFRLGRFASAGGDERSGSEPIR